jgi:hypothetical protein
MCVYYANALDQITQWERFRLIGSCLLKIDRPESQFFVELIFYLTFRFGIKCWFAHGREELRSVPRLDRHPEAALDAVNQVIDSLPPSRSRKGMLKFRIRRIF